MQIYQTGALLLLFCLVVRAAPYNEEGSAYISQDTIDERPRSASIKVPSVLHGSSTDSPLFGNRQTPASSLPQWSGRPPIWKMFQAWKDPQKRVQEPTVDPYGLKAREAWKRKLIWERATKRNGAKSHPTQILHIDQEDMTRAKCQALPFVQVVWQKNCHPVRVPNRFCFGQCNSFYVPGWPAGLAQPCASCMPSRSRSSFVTLHCHGGRTSQILVELIEECDCMTRYEDVEKTPPVGSGEGFLHL
ncbi:DAN domain family member 5 [Discoglossus pictus]